MLISGCFFVVSHDTNDKNNHIEVWGVAFLAFIANHKLKWEISNNFVSYAIWNFPWSKTKAINCWGFSINSSSTTCLVSESNSFRSLDAYTERWQIFTGIYISICSAYICGGKKSDRISDAEYLCFLTAEVCENLSSRRRFFASLEGTHEKKIRVKKIAPYAHKIRIYSVLNLPRASSESIMCDKYIPIFSLSHVSRISLLPFLVFCCLKSTIYGDEKPEKFEAAKVKMCLKVVPSCTHLIEIVLR